MRAAPCHKEAHFLKPENSQKNPPTLFGTAYLRPAIAKNSNNKEISGLISQFYKHIRH